MFSIMWVSLILSWRSLEKDWHPLRKKAGCQQTPSSLEGLSVLQPASLLPTSNLQACSADFLNLPGSTTIMSQFLKLLIDGERKRNLLHTMTEWNRKQGFSNCKSWDLYNFGDNTNSNYVVLFILYYVLILL